MTLFSALSSQELMLAFGVAFLAGWVKGMVGFAMPMILVSGLSMIVFLVSFSELCFDRPRAFPCCGVGFAGVENSALGVMGPRPAR